MKFRIRWQDIVKKLGDMANNGTATIEQVNETTYRVEIKDTTLTPRTSEGVDLTLEEFEITNDRWQKVEGSRE